MDTYTDRHLKLTDRRTQVKYHFFHYFLSGYSVYSENQKMYVAQLRTFGAILPFVISTNTEVKWTWVDHKR